MTPLKTLCLALLIPFGALTIYALMQVGYVGIPEYHIHSPAGWQVFADLVISLLLIMIWMVRDARQKGRTVWPYIVATLAAGVFGPLFYLLLAPSEGS